MADRQTKQIRNVLLGLVAAAFLLRMLHFFAVFGTPWLDRYMSDPSGDDFAFFQWAQAIVGGDWFGHDTYHPYFPWMRKIAPIEDWYALWGGKEIFHQAPLYPYMLALLLFLYGGSVSLVLATQLLLGSLQVLVSYGLGRRLFDYRIGLAAGATTAFYGPYSFYQSTLLRDWLVPILEPLSVLALLKASTSGRWFAWGAAGCTLGIAVLLKPTALLLAGGAFLWIAYDRWKAWSEMGRAVAALSAGFILVLTPLFLRNAVVGAPLFALSTRATEALILANNPDDASAALRTALSRSRGQASSVLQKAPPLDPEAFARIFERQIQKANVLASPYETPNNTSFYYVLDLSPPLRWTLGYAVIFPLGIAGFLIGLKSWRRHALLILYGLITLSALLATSPIARYRLALVPVLTLYGAAALVWWLDLLRARRIAAAAGIAGLFFLLVFAQRLLGQQPYPTFPHDYYNAAVAYRQRNDFDKAVERIATLARKLMQESPESREAFEATGMEGDYRVEWAKELVRLGRTDRARAQVELAADAYSRDPSLVLSHYNLGVLFIAVHEYDQARRSLRQFLYLAPQHPKARLARDLLARIEGL